MHSLPVDSGCKIHIIMKKLILIILTLLLPINITSMATKTEQVSVGTAVEATVKLFLSQPIPETGTVDGEWKLIGLVRSSADIPQEYKDGYYNKLCNKLREVDGVLSKRNYSEYARATLGVTVIGRDAGDVGGYNLLEKLADYKAVTRQTINATAWALIAIDSNNYDIPDSSVEVLTDRSALVQHLLDKQLDDGGWAVFGQKGDIDVTAMVLTSLAGYYDVNTAVKQAADRAAQFLSENQNDNGGYTAWNVTSSESIAQVITALCSVGINPKTDSRFIKNGNSLIDALLEYYTAGGGFCHLQGEERSQLASEQGLYALAAYKRLTEGKSALFDMRDIFTVKESTTAQSVQNVTENSTTERISVTEKYITSARNNTASFELRKATQANSTSLRSSEVGNSVKASTKPVYTKPVATEPKPESSNSVQISTAETKNTEASASVSTSTKAHKSEITAGSNAQTTSYSASEVSSVTAEKTDSGEQPLQDKLNDRKTVIFAVLTALAAGIIVLFIFKKIHKR